IINIGIPRIPVLGSYALILWGNYFFPYKTIEYYAEKLKSKIIGCYFGSIWVVVANDYASIKQVLERDEFDGRVTQVEVLKARTFGKAVGIFFSDGTLWHEQRKLVLRNARDFGFGRRQNAIEKEISDETALLIDILKHGPVYDGEKEVMKDNSVLSPDILSPTIYSSIWYVLFGQRFCRSEHDIPR
ncbi:Probable cytochrome P450 304a1, partial [Harpegnathos saltator]